MKDYKIDFATNTVVITKAFAKKAAVYNSDEFRIMSELTTIMRRWRIFSAP